MEQLYDRNGLTEKEFLARYDVSKWERPSVTVDIILYAKKTGSVLLIRRGNHPFLGKLALPGGFVEPDETLEQAAARELMEETGAKVSSLRQVRAFSEPDRDPRTRIITVAFLAVTEDELPVAAGDDAADARYYQVEQAPGKLTLSCGETLFTVGYTVANAQDTDPVYTVTANAAMAGDHAQILITALDML